MDFTRNVYKNMEMSESGSVLHNFFHFFPLPPLSKSVSSQFTEVSLLPYVLLIRSKSLIVSEKFRTYPCLMMFVA